MTTKQAQDRGSFVGKVKQSVELQPHVSSWLSKFVIRNSGGTEETLDFTQDKVSELINRLDSELQRPANDRTNWRFIYNNSTGSGGQPNKYVVSMDNVYESEDQLFPEEPESKSTEPAPKANAPVARREDPVQANIRRSVAVNKSVDAAPTIMDFMLMQPGGTEDEINTIGNLDASTALWARTINTMTNYLETIQLRELKGAGD